MFSASARELLPQGPPPVSHDLGPCCCAVWSCRDWAQFNINCSVVVTVSLLLLFLVHPWGDGAHVLTLQVVAVVLLLLFLVHQAGLAVQYAGFSGGNHAEIRQMRTDLDDKRLGLDSLLLSMLQGTVADLVINCNQRFGGYRMDIIGILSDMEAMFDGEQQCEVSGAAVSRLDMLWDGLFAMVTAGSGWPIRVRGSIGEALSGQQGLRVSRGDIEEIRGRWSRRPAPHIQLDAGAFACVQANLDHIRQSFGEFDELGRRLRSAQQARAWASRRRRFKHWHSWRHWGTLGPTYMCRVWACCCWYGYLSPCHVVLWVSLAVDAGSLCGCAVQLRESDEESFFSCLLLLLSAAVLALNISVLLFNIEDIDFGLRERRELRLLQEADRTFRRSLQHLHGVEASLQAMRHVHFGWAALEVLKWTWFQFREEWRHCHGEARGAHRGQLRCLSQALDTIRGWGADRLLEFHREVEEMQVRGVVYDADRGVFTDEGLRRWGSGALGGAPRGTGSAVEVEMASFDSARPSLRSLDGAAAGCGGDAPGGDSHSEHRLLAFSLPESAAR